MFIKVKGQHQNQPQHKFPNLVPIKQEGAEEDPMNQHSNVRNTTALQKIWCLEKILPILSAKMLYGSILEQSVRLEKVY